MSLPPLNPEKTAAGIIVDPKTLERVVPQSRRSDGTVRKERKIRPGFTPQEDVGLFRPKAISRENSNLIPGSNRPKPPTTTQKSENPFAQESKEKTKAQLKNERRREKKREKVSVNWDEDDDDDGGDADEMKEAFEQVDKAKARTAAPEGGAEQGYPPLEGGGAPNESVLDEVKAEEEKDEKVSSQTEVLTAPPPGPETTQTKAPAQTSLLSPASEIPPSTSSNAKSSSIIDDRKAELRSKPQQQKPHPIQGGRKGPIGLAHPPPIESEKPKPPPPQTRADSADSWRSARKPQSQKPPRTQNGGGGGGGGGQAQGQSKRTNKPPPGSGPASGQGATKPANENKPAAAPAPAPRERREVKVRQGGANDVSSLANRVKNLVIASTTGNGSPREKKTQAPASEQKSEAT
ncbi:hypothetical protein CI109_103373 [Kwoniella shandongensis]|uniref:Uncharacterized protein n=1 Tax=Kwoniella shandongensis TaxID=1734106 RepID=A0A5M6BZ94_9TREE|nr:uncharacterized protein CI109_004454 [Kwoniella shandongensis]KAA5527162.1 hypothetical protein CI109_004454 [Kwoniella shandongensis]